MASTPYHPQANSQVESTNNILEGILTKTVHLHKKDWAEKLPEALWAYRTTWKDGTWLTPCEMVYGKQVLFLLEFHIKNLMDCSRSGDGLDKGIERKNCPSQ